MRNATDNPFEPGSDIAPTVWAGRSDQLHDWRDVVRPRRIKGLAERGRTLLGEPGLGKSALVDRIRDTARRDGDWVTDQLRIPIGGDPFKKVADALLALADEAGISSSRDRAIADTLSRVRTVAASGVSISMDRAEGPEPHTALTALLIELGRAALRGDHMVLVHIDEVQNITEPATLSQLLIALGDALNHKVAISAPGGVTVEVTLPISVYLTGLPEFMDLADSRGGATFARRFATTTLVALSDDDLAEALQAFVIEGWEVPDDHGGLTRVRMDADAATAIIDLCRGEPFLFQLAGQAAWNAGSGNVITVEHVHAGWERVQAEAVAHVERILNRLPERERAMVDAMADLEPGQRTLTRIAAEMGYDKASDAGPTASRLDTVRGVINRGKPYSFRHKAVEAYLTSDWPRIN